MLLLWLLSMLSGRKGSASPAPAVVTTSTPKAAPAVAVKAATMPAPWPAPAPTSLPPFPGPGWVPDVPPPTEVQARALQVLAPLHARGIGQHTIELTGGRWIAYVARMHGAKKAVEAFRLATEQKAQAPVIAPPLAWTQPGRPKVSPAAPVAVTPASGASTAVPATIRRGSRGELVRRAQAALGLPAAEQDGVFGPKTEAATRQYQTHNNLEIDGVIGPQTWASLLKGNA